MIIKKWILKAIVQKLISILPFSFRINYFLQLHVTRRVRLSDEFLDTMIGHQQEAESYWNRHGAEIRGARILELGTGWHPVIPVLYFLSGAAGIVTIDLRPLIRKENLRQLLSRITELDRTSRLSGMMRYIEPGRVATLETLLSSWNDHTVEDIMSRLRIHQWIGNAARLDFEDDSFDLCTSVNVLEHVDQDSVEPIVRELRRVIKSGGLHYHAIGTYDHFVHADKTISKFNYLKFSKSQWSFIDNSIQPQNRLRLSWFRDLFSALGIDIKDELLWEAEPEELSGIKVHPDFAGKELLDVPYGTYILCQP
jgi:SAM-dependent methyltransferase